MLLPCNSQSVGQNTTMMYDPLNLSNISGNYHTKNTLNYVFVPLYARLDSACGSYHEGVGGIVQEGVSAHQE